MKKLTATFTFDTTNDYVTIYDYIGNSILKIDLKGNLIEQVKV